MAFAEDEDEVAFFGGIKSKFDGFFTIWFEEKIFAFGLAGFFGAFNEALHDLIKGFITRIILGDDDDVGMLPKNFAADGASGGVTTTSTTVDGDDTAFVTFDRIKDFF